MKYHIKTISLGDSEYSKMLGQISDPPKRLYYRGNISLLNTFTIGIVGTRKLSDYGRSVTIECATSLARAGVTIASGLASGIDSIAHQATLDVNGSTIAVFGTGVDDDSVFPSDNIRLVYNILDGDGLVISEYENGTHGQKFTFPARNRIISGLSHGVLIVEADRKSGSLITARCALDQNRDVFAVPGSIYWPRSVGANWLIQEGAKLVLSPSDILDVYGKDEALARATGAPLSTGDPVRTAILELLNKQGPTHIDKIAAYMAESDAAARVLSAIALLELDGTVVHQGGGVYYIASRHV